MPKVTSAPAGAHETANGQFRSTATDGHRVIYHEPICPTAGPSRSPKTRSTPATASTKSA